MTTSMLLSWRPERSFGMPAFTGAEGSLSLRAASGLRGDVLGSGDYVSFEQVKPAAQPTHINLVGAPSS